jgi:diaminopimelate decarboxylase
VKQQVINAAKTTMRFVGSAIARRRSRRVDLALSRWGLEVGLQGHLARHGVDLVTLTETYGSPLVLVDGDALDRAASEAMRTSADGPAADIFYSYKTNPVPAVLAALHQCGVGAEVISPYELWLALRLGVTGERIIYNGPAKSFESLRVAVRSGAAAINANSIGDLALIRRAARAEGARANVGLRVALPTMWQGQFGFNSESTDLLDAVRQASDDPDLDLRAIHLHRGLSMRTADDFESYVREVLAFCDTLRQATGFHPTILDLGGSLTCPTVSHLSTKEYRLNRALATDLIPPDPSTAVSVGEASRLAATIVAEHATAAGLPIPRVVLEPGRALTSSSQMLLATVHDVKRDGAIPHVVLDAGVNVAEPTSTEYHQLFSVTSPTAAHETSYRVVGPICTPADVLYNHWRLPEVEPGHVLAIMDTGAYFVPFSTSFSFPRPAIVIQRGQSIEVGRSRETFDHLVALDQLP